MERTATLLLLLLLNIIMWIADCCYPGIESIGTVSPLGDINSEVGSNITINCTLNENYDGTASANDIRWRRNSTEVPKQFITVLNSRTAQLHLINTSMEDSGYYSCYVNAKEQSTVCNNDVRIGKPPPSEVNITCLSQNWMNLTCLWSAPYNPVHTKWSFFYRLYKYRLECPVYLNSRTGCFFSENTQPPYRPAAKEYYFYLEGENPLGNNRINFIFNHYQDVLPNPPSELLILEMDSRLLEVKWNAPKGMQLFPPNLFYQLEYLSEWDSAWKVQSIGLNITSIILTSLIPNTNYTVKVYCRSGSSETSPWSQPSVTWKKTLADVPGAAPKMIAGSFQQRKTITKRDIYIHWQSIPKLLENGNDVSYVIDAEEDGLQLEVAIQEQSLTSALISNLELEKTYIFRLRTQNEKGISMNTSFLTVYPAHQLPPKPDYINVVAYEGGIYEVSWILGDAVDVGTVDNFTIFWCESSKRANHPCYDSDIAWQIVDGNQSEVNLTLSNDKNYLFAFAINSGLYSSGMTFATCIVPHDGVVGKLKSVSVLHNRIHELELSWKLDCSERTGIVTGFNVYYCMYNETTQRCLGNKTNQEHYSNPHAERYALMHLKPYTTYKISVSAVTKAGEGEKSDPIINRTNEGAPEDQPHLGLSLVSNSTVAVAVQNPQNPNGEIRQFRFYLNNKRWENVTTKGQEEFVLTNLDSYTNYSVQVTACTIGELCSPPSPVLWVRTGVGIPSSPVITKIQPYNATHVRFEWDDPEKPNGPITSWNIHLAWKGNGSQYFTQMLPVLENGSRIRFIPLPMSCVDNNEIHPRAEYNFSIQAKTTNLDGLPSKSFITQPCLHRGNEVLSVWVVIVIGICSMFFICCILLLMCHGIQRLKKKLKEIQNIKVQLPKGLDSPNMSSLVNFGDYKSAFHGSLVHRPIHQNCSKEKASAKDIRCSSSSIDELLYSLHGQCPEPKNGISRMLSIESSGCSTCPESVSSSATAHTHLSFDSGADVDMPFSPMLDCVFMPPADATIYKVKPGIVSQTHHSQVGHYPSKTLPPSTCLAEVKNGFDSNQYDDDYLQPTAATVAHTPVKMNQQESPTHRKDSQPCVPPKLKQALLSSQNQKPFNIYPQMETGYAKVGLSHTALQNQYARCAEEVQKQQNNNDNDDDQIVFAPKPSMVKEFTKRAVIMPPIAARTSTVPSVIDKRLQETQEKCDSVTLAQTGVQRNPYVTLDDLCNSPVLHNASQSSSELSDNNNASAKTSSSNLTAGIPKTYSSMSQLTSDSKPQVFAFQSVSSPLRSGSITAQGYCLPISNVELFAGKPIQPSTILWKY